MELFSFTTRSRTVELMRKPSPLCAVGNQFVPFEDHDDAALRVDRLNRQVENHREEFGQRTILGEFLPRANQRLHGR